MVLPECYMPWCYMLNKFEKTLFFMATGSLFSDSVVCSWMLSKPVVVWHAILAMYWKNKFCSCIKTTPILLKDTNFNCNGNSQRCQATNYKLFNWQLLKSEKKSIDFFPQKWILFTLRYLQFVRDLKFSQWRVHPKTWLIILLQS